MTPVVLVRVMQEVSAVRLSPVVSRFVPGPTPADPSECDATAAQQLGWGASRREPDFDGTTLPADWHPYGPQSGHTRNGTRTPEAMTVAGGNVTITGTADGTTGAMSRHPGQECGRWEACVRSDEGGGGLNALFLHYGADNRQEVGSVRHDATQWSAYAVEWTPEKTTTYVGGKGWYSTSDTSHFPPGPMAMTMQLDYFGGARDGTAVHMDRARQLVQPESEPAGPSLAPGDPATGQPRDHPERVPRMLG